MWAGGHGWGGMVRGLLKSWDSTESHVWARPPTRQSDAYGVAHGPTPVRQGPFR